jgi:hypothetical protein
MAVKVRSEKPAILQEPGRPRPGFQNRVVSG